MTEQEHRLQVVAEARAWLGTPYVLGQRVKGAGVDCAQLLAAVYIACGLFPDEDQGIFAGDWFCHASAETYMLRVLRHAPKVADAICFRRLAALPGDIVLTKAAGSHVFNHGCIVVRWPRVIHAIEPCVEEIDASTHPLWAHQQVAVFSPWTTDAR